MVEALARSEEDVEVYSNPELLKKALEEAKKQVAEELAAERQAQEVADLEELREAELLEGEDVVPPAIPGSLDPLDRPLPDPLAPPPASPPVVQVPLAPPPATLPPPV